MNIQSLDSDKSIMQNVKQRFFALRNGVLADILRKSGSPYRIVFGLNLPQLREISSAFGADQDLAEALWANDSTRESRLMAPMVADRAKFGIGEVRRWIASIKGTEEADILCHSLLRHTGYVSELVSELAESDKALERYVVLRLIFSRVASAPDEALRLALAEIGRNDALTRTVAAQLKEEALFVLE